LAVWYKPLAGPQVLLGCFLYCCNRIGAFPQVPKGETLFNKIERKREKEREREREKERVGLRCPPQLRHGVGAPWRTDSTECWMVMVTFLGRLSQFGTTYTNLR
jgi:hypothetical protein